MKKHLGLQITKYFTKESWLELIDNYDLSHFEIFFFNSDKVFFEIVDNLDYLFILNFKEIYLTKISNLEMLYVGVSDLDYLDKISFPNGLKVHFSKGISSKYIAEYNLLAALTLIRNFKTAMINQSNFRWDQEYFLSSPMDSILDHKIGIVGMGHNGKATGKIFSKLGCQISYVSRTKKETQLKLPLD